MNLIKRQEMAARVPGYFEPYGASWHQHYSRTIASPPVDWWRKPGERVAVKHDVVNEALSAGLYPPSVIWAVDCDKVADGKAHLKQYYANAGLSISEADMYSVPLHARA